jgi:hypothetical protein
MKGLLKSAIRDDNPVFFIEHQWVYLEKAVVPLEEYTVPLGVGNVVRSGKDITVVAYSNMVSRTVAAADKLQKEEGISVEIVDPRTLVPLDIDLVAKSVRKTGRAMVVVQAPYTGGYASHISHEITRTCFDRLQVPVRIVSAYDVPPPMAFPLESENIPNVDRIARGIKEVLGARAKVSGAAKAVSSSGARVAAAAKTRAAAKAKAPVRRSVRSKASAASKAARPVSSKKASGAKSKAKAGAKTKASRSVRSKVKARGKAGSKRAR